MVLDRAFQWLSFVVAVLVEPLPQGIACSSSSEWLSETGKTCAQLTTSECASVGFAFGFFDLLFLLLCFGLGKSLRKVLFFPHSLGCVFSFLFFGVGRESMFGNFFLGLLGGDPVGIGESGLYGFFLFVFLVEVFD